jgi:NDP-sugar pyrophosphorylase family protein
MKKQLKMAAIIFVSLGLISCTYNSNRFDSKYGNEKLLKEEKNIQTGAKIADVEMALGKPSRIYKTAIGGKLYEYEYHQSKRSALYFIPFVSSTYYILTTNIFNPFAKSVQAKITHNYLFLEFDKNGLMHKKEFFQDTGNHKLYPYHHCANTGGMHSCNNNFQINSKIEY